MCSSSAAPSSGSISNATCLCPTTTEREVAIPDALSRAAAASVFFSRSFVAEIASGPPPPPPSSSRPIELSCSSCSASISRSSSDVRPRRRRTTEVTSTQTSSPPSPSCAQDSRSSAAIDCCAPLRLPHPLIVSRDRVGAAIASSGSLGPASEVLPRPPSAELPSFGLSGRAAAVSTAASGGSLGPASEPRPELPSFGLSGRGAAKDAIALTVAAVARLPFASTHRPGCDRTG